MARQCGCVADLGRACGLGTAVYFPPGKLKALVREQGKQIS